MKRCIILLLSAFIAVFLCCGCQSDSSEPTVPAEITLPETLPPEIPVQTDAPTEAVTEPATQPATESTTEPPTEPVSLPYLQAIGRDDQSIFDGPGYDYCFAGTVEIATVYTIVEEAWDPDGNLWGRLKSGAGWVDLTEIRSWETSYEPISANFADDRLIHSGTYHHCVADTSEYAVQLAFRAYDVLYDFSFYSLAFVDSGYEPDELLFSLPELTPEKPFVADVAFPGDMSMFAVSFTDKSGTVYNYSVSISGRNGALILSEYAP